MALIEDLARVDGVDLQATQAFESAPERRVCLQGIFVHLYRLPSFQLSLIYLAKEEESGCPVWDLAEDVLLRIMLLQWSRLLPV